MISLSASQPPCLGWSVKIRIVKSNDIFLLLYCSETWGKSRTETSKFPGQVSQHNRDKPVEQSIILELLIN